MDYGDGRVVGATECISCHKTCVFKRQRNEIKVFRALKRVGMWIVFDDRHVTMRSTFRFVFCEQCFLLKNISYDGCLLKL